jgi:hypothetical protein
MAIQLAGLLLPALKAVGSAKLPLLLRTAGAVGGGAPALMRGDLLGAVTGAGLGALGTVGMGNLAGQGTKAAAKSIFARGTAAGLSPGNIARLQGVAQAGIPLAGGLALGGLSSGITGPAVGNVARGAAGLAGYGVTRGEGMGGSALPPGVGPYGMVSPTGNPIDVLNPIGLEAGRRTRTVKDAEALRDAQNIVLPTVRKFSEQAKKDDFQRSLAAEGIKANLLLNRNLTEGLAQATRQMGTTAAEQAGSALTTQYNY